MIIGISNVVIQDYHYPTESRNNRGIKVWIQFKDQLYTGEVLRKYRYDMYL